MNSARIAHVLKAIEGAATPMALLVNGVISYENKNFRQLYGGLQDKAITQLFAAEALEQLRWLIGGSRGEADKIILPLKEGVCEDYADKDLMVQIWPIDDEFCFLSLRPDYSVKRLADVDELTGLPNRRKAMMLLDIEKARANRSQDFCLALCDIDHFKLVNDTHGHEVGDKVLQYIAEVMTSQLREGDWIARWGGEEFMLFAADSDLITGIQPMERIRQALENNAYPGPPTLNITMSFGLASSAGHRDTRTLINKADMLLYEAKHNGRNRIEWEGGHETVWIADNIHKAFNSGALTAAYAPIYDMQGNVRLRQVVPYLQGYGDQEVEKMMSAVERLHQQTVVDRALIKAVERDLKTSEHPAYLFPLSQQSFTSHEEEIEEFLRRHPDIGVAIDARAPPLQHLIEQFLCSRPLALYNYDPKNSPSYLLGLPGLAGIIFSSSKNAEGILALLKDTIPCFLKFRYPPDDHDKQRLQKQGFCGWVAAPPAQESPAAG